jgi:hypothetical protein
MRFMKKVLLTFATILLFGTTFAAPISYEDAKRARGGVAIYDVITLSRDLDKHMGEPIGVMCNARNKEIHHPKPNWYESALWQPDPTKRGKFANVRVMIAKKDLDAFKSIPTIVTPGAGVILQGRVEHDAQANFSFLRLIYNNAPRDTTAHP